MKTSTQLKALIRNLSKTKGVEAEVILRNFMFERFLERVSASPYKDNFILKGGMLIASMVGIGARATMDIDATIKAKALSQESVTKIITGILSVPVDDGALFSLRDVSEIRAEADYPGFRASVDSFFDKTRQTLKIDITTGDYITPREIEYSFPLMFEDRSISIMAYNLETVLAEKFETIITLGVATTRMRDFYDIYILTSTRDAAPQVFKAALSNTVAKRGTARQIADSPAVIRAVTDSPVMLALWSRYQAKYSYAAGVSWGMATEALSGLAQMLP